MDSKTDFDGRVNLNLTLACMSYDFSLREKTKGMDLKVAPIEARISPFSPF